MRPASATSFFLRSPQQRFSQEHGISRHRVSREGGQAGGGLPTTRSHAYHCEVCPSLSGKPTLRNSNIEALRIIAMLAVVFHHFARYSEIGNTVGVSWQQLANAVFMSYGKWGVDVFVLVSAYFLSTRSSAPIRQVVRLYVQVWTTSVLVLASVLLVGLAPVGGKAVIKSIAPIVGGNYWFATTFIVLLLFSPALNVFLRAASQRLHLATIVLMLLLWGVVQLLPGSPLDYSEILLFVELYFIANYIRRYVPVRSVRPWLAASLVLLTVIGIAGAAIQATTMWRPGNADLVIALASDSSPLTIAAAACAFCAARAAAPQTSRAINSVAGMSFGVYLFHQNPLVVDHIWTWSPFAAGLAGSPLMPLYAVATVVSIYVLCTALEYIRFYSLQRPIMKLLDPTVSALERFVPRIANQVVEVVDGVASGREAGDASAKAVGTRR